MSSLALMRWLESAPARYDAGMRWITLGRVTRLHDRLADEAAPHAGRRVLEIGCGTGAVTRRLVARGARVTAVDHNPEMIDLAREGLVGAAPGSVEWVERTASEIDSLPEAGFDSFVASLCLSEMSRSERGFVLREARSRLAAGGIAVVADEVRPRGRVQRIVHTLFRLPQALLGWLVAGSVSRPIPDLAGELRAAGFRIRGEHEWLFGGLAMWVAEPDR